MLSNFTKFCNFFFSRTRAGQRWGCSRLRGARVCGVLALSARGSSSCTRPLAFSGSKGGVVLSVTNTPFSAGCGAAEFEVGQRTLSQAAVLSRVYLLPFSYVVVYFAG